jgi:hypothetical protein
MTFPVERLSFVLHLHGTVTCKLYRTADVSFNVPSDGWTSFSSLGKYTSIKEVRGVMFNSKATSHVPSKEIVKNEQC